MFHTIFETGLEKNETKSKVEIGKEENNTSGIP